GTQPYRGLRDALRAHPDILSVWSRRAMWKPTVMKDLQKIAADFGLIIEPGELADSVDTGLTVRHRDDVVLVDPITFLDEGEILDRASARAALSISGDEFAVLVQLGAGNINDTAS